FLYANGPLLKKHKRQYLEEQTRLYGTDHIYGVDCFNEVAPPSWEPADLRNVGRTVMESLTDVDPQARWLQMTWLFYYDKNWTPERIEAYLSGVPKGRMILLDYFCDNTPLWERTDNFHGHDYIWCFLGNFGGTTFLIGNPKETSQRIDRCSREGGRNFAGIGSTLEGFDVNPYLYEFVFDKAWNRPLTDSETFANIARSRSGSSPSAAKAWQLLIDSVYTQRTGVGHATLNNSRPCLTGKGCSYVKNSLTYSNATLVNAWELLLEADGNGRDTYRFDLVNVGRQALGNYFRDLRDDFNRAYLSGSVDSLQIVGHQMRELLADISTLLSCHPTFSLRRWLEEARSMTDDPTQKDYYERNARTLITYWGGDRIFDYANRAYAELNRDFYAQRWHRFIDQVTASVRHGQKFDQKAFNAAISEFEHSWTEPTSHPVNYMAQGDATATARQMFDKYANRMRA
ncbi:MAG: alpha-N-acetylglucosaminidase, partial [Firmicutes bacterium]|nr:alpha-N-acetylglucosaminidase [Bacillota bacterium]